MGRKMQHVKKIAITGGSGQIVYSLAFRIANGDLFGPHQRVQLHLCDLPEMQEVLKGVAMELSDCAFPLLHRVEIGSDLEKMFNGIDLALLVGAKPRTKGMERKDLLRENAEIFVSVGKALNSAADKNCKVLVVGNPCNTNCLIALQHAPMLNPRNFHAMMRLDENRAKALLAQKAHVTVDQLRRVVVWGNHSLTQVPDYHNAWIGKKRVEESIEIDWLQQEFIQSVQQRGAAILAARGKSSAASAANALVDAAKALYFPTPKGECFTSAVLSDGNPYGIVERIIFGFPMRTLENGTQEIVEDFEWDYFMKEKIALTQNELLEEKKGVETLLRG